MGLSERRRQEQDTKEKLFNRSIDIVRMNGKGKEEERKGIEEGGYEKGDYLTYGGL